VASAYVGLVLTGMAGVDPSAKLIAIILADCANLSHQGVSFPSIATIMQRSNLSERQVQYHLRELTASNWIMPEGATHGGRGHATRYRLNLAKLRAAVGKDGAEKGAADCTLTDPVKGAADRRVSEPVKGAMQGKKGAMDGIKRVQPIAPEPEGTVRDREKVAAAVLGLRSTLLKKIQPEKQPEKMPDATVQAQPIEQPPDRPQRTQEEQIAWIAAQLRNTKP